MIKIQIVCIGKLKEKFFFDASVEYKKRLSRYAKVTVDELPNISIPSNASAIIEGRIKEDESRALYKRIQKNATLIALDPKGRSITSNDMAGLIRTNDISGKPITFLIGGSLGLSGDVKKHADHVVSFSSMTFPHQLFRVMLLEQIYRGFKILKGEKYHK